MTVAGKPKAKPERGEEDAVPVAVPVGSASRVLVGPAGSDANRGTVSAVVIPAVDGGTMLGVVTAFPGRPLRPGELGGAEEVGDVPVFGELGCVGALGPLRAPGALSPGVWTVALPPGVWTVALPPGV